MSEKFLKANQKVYFFSEALWRTETWACTDRQVTPASGGKARPSCGKGDKAAVGAAGALPVTGHTHTHTRFVCTPGVKSRPRQVRLELDVSRD